MTKMLLILMLLSHLNLFVWSFLIILVSFEGSNTFLVVFILVGFNTVVLFSELEGTLLVASETFEFDELYEL